MVLSDIDPAQLILESYRIEGISAAECRSIFLDWALKLPDGIDQTQAIKFLVETYVPGVKNHPMNAVLQGALETPRRTGRRGGWRARAVR